jgi:hypothetical protein
MKSLMALISGLLFSKLAHIRAFLVNIPKKTSTKLSQLAEVGV